MRIPRLLRPLLTREVLTFKPAVTGNNTLLIGVWFTDGFSDVFAWVTAKGRGV